MSFSNPVTKIERLILSSDRHNVITALKRIARQSASSHESSCSCSSAVLERLVELAHSWDDEVQRRAIRAVEDISGKHKNAAFDTTESVFRRATADLSSQAAFQFAKNKVLLTRQNRVLARISKELVSSESGVRNRALSNLQRLLKVNSVFCVRLLQHAATFEAVTKIASLRTEKDTNAVKVAADILQEVASVVERHNFDEVEVQQRLCVKLLAALAYLSQDAEQNTRLRRTTSNALETLNCVGTSSVEQIPFNTTKRLGVLTTSGFVFSCKNSQESNASVTHLLRRYRARL